MSRIIFAVLVFGAAALAADAGAELFQKAVTEERAAGNLEAAIKLYQRVAGEFASNRPLAAKALVQEARCYEKLGQDTAVRLYEQVARDFSDQPEQATAARERLVALGAGTKSKAGTAMMAHQIPLPPAAVYAQSDGRPMYAQSDGRHVFYLDYRAGGLIAARMDGTDPRVVLPFPLDRARNIAPRVSISPDGKKVASSLSESGKSTFVIAAVDGSGVREVYRMALPGKVGGWSPDGTHLLGDIEEPDGSQTVVIVSALDGSLQKIRNEFAIKGKGALAALGGGGSLFSPDGKYVVLSVRTGTSFQTEIRIVAVDGSYGAKLVDHPSFNGPIDFTPNGKYLLFQSDRSGSAGIYALAVSDGRAQGEPELVKQEAGTFNNGAYLTKDGTLLYSVGGLPRHAIFTAKLDSARGILAAAPQVFAGPSGMTPESGAWSPDGQKLAYLSGRNHLLGGGDTTLTIRTISSGEEVAYKVPPAMVAVPGWAADGRGVYTAQQYGVRGTDLRMELHSMSADTGADTRVAVIPEAEVVYSVRPAPDGNALLIAFGNQPPRPGRPAGLIRVDLQSGQQTEIIPRGVVSEMTISPDGTQVAALDRQANSAKLLVKPVNGGDWKTLATLQGTGYMYLHWMPNGALIFAKEGFPNSTLFRISTSSGAMEKVGELTSLNHVHEIDVHPDGQQLMFQSFVTRTELWALENFLPKEMRGR